MAKVEIKIDRISIRGRGIRPQVAHAVAHGFGQELLQGLAQYRNRLTPGRPSPGDLYLDTLHTESGDARTLRRTIGQAITQAIVAKSSKVGGKKEER